MSTNNKNCGISGELLIDFLLEELSLEETADLDNHIRECHSCSVELEF
ncbi:zf-HC2 domain-containing protein, partial [candidate division KSB1 bacterium]|nr:zf-HC2 domain-containing protein [candidate division KSB1 bacterium]